MFFHFHKHVLKKNKCHFTTHFPSVYYMCSFKRSVSIQASRTNLLRIWLEFEPHFLYISPARTLNGVLIFGCPSLSCVYRERQKISAISLFVFEFAHMMVNEGCHSSPLTHSYPLSPFNEPSSSNIHPCLPVDVRQDPYSYCILVQLFFGKGKLLFHPLCVFNMLYMYVYEMLVWFCFS